MSILIDSNEYKIIKELGEGGNGKVFQVLNEKNNKFYAIKKISMNNLEENYIKLIKNEAEILSSIDDEHIVKYYGSSEVNNNFYILMEFCKGLDLKKFINKYKERKEFINEKIIYIIVLDLCLGIKVIQNHKLIHRDLKPENLFIDDNYKIKIGDFGVSKKLETNKNFAYTSVGTNFYMAPEVIKGEEYNNKVDIWSFGCIIYELFTLEVCFQSESLLGFVENIINKEHGKIDLNKYNHKWQDVIDLLLKKKHNERPDIDEIYQILIDLNKDNKEENDSFEYNSDKKENNPKEKKKYKM